MKTKKKKSQSIERKPPDEVTGAEIIRWVEATIYVPEGKYLSHPLRLANWQKDEIKNIYDNPAGTRRAILSFGRKNGKTTLAACLLLLHLCGPKVLANSSMYSAAQSREQAAIIFGLAVKMVRMSPILRDQVHIKETTKELFCQAWGTRYRALSSEGSTAFGLSPIFVVHDELGQARGPHNAVFEALETATGAQENPLSIIISTQAPTNNDLLSILIDDARAGHDPRIICSLYTAPEEMDPFEEDTIRLANPALGNFLNIKEVLTMAEDARRMPSREPEYRNLVLNQRVEALSPFISTSLWAACNHAPRPLQQVPVYGGLDLSEVRDLTALVLIGRHDDGVWHVHPTFWLPENNLEAKSKIDRIPYALWARQGFLRTCPGNSVSYEYIAQYMREVFASHMMVKIGFDRWNMKHFIP